MPRGVGDKFVDIGSTRCQHLPGAGTAGRAVPVVPVATGLVGGWRLVKSSNIGAGPEPNNTELGQRN